MLISDNKFYLALKVLKLFVKTIQKSNDIHSVLYKKNVQVKCV